jgi:hypothetical protein
MLKMKTISILAIAGLVLALAPAAQAGTIFEADFQGAVDQAASSVTLVNLNAGTQTGIWSGIPDSSLLGSDGSNRGALIEQDGVNLTATFSPAGALATGVTVSYDATVRRGISNGTGRTAVMKGIASDGKVLFVLGLQSELPVVGRRLIAYSEDFAPAPGVNTVPAYISLGVEDEFTQGTSVYNDAIMETIRLELTTTSFDVYINNVLAANGDDIPYFAAAGDINRLNFQSDNAGGAWYDNLSVVSPPAPASTPGTLIYGK